MPRHRCVCSLCHTEPLGTVKNLLLEDSGVEDPRAERENFTGLFSQHWLMRIVLVGVISQIENGR